MKNVIGYLCIFMAFIVVCTFCGGLFGIAASGTFTDSISSFGSTLNRVKTGVIDPFNRFLRFFGLGTSVGGEALIYVREPDVQYADVIPSNAEYACFQIIYKITSDSDVKLNLNSFLHPILIFFDEDGNPISGYLLHIKNGKFNIVNSGDELGSSFFFLAEQLDCSYSYFNPFSKFLYLDCRFKGNLYGSSEIHTFRCKLNSSLLDFEFAGDLSYIEKGLLSGSGKGGKF